MWDFFNNIVIFLSENILWFVLIYMFHMGYRAKAEWVQSVRSIAAAMLTVVFAKLALGSKIDPKDVMLIVSLVYNFYFLVKQRTAPGNGNGDLGTPTK